VPCVVERPRPNVQRNEAAIEELLAKRLLWNDLAEVECFEEEIVGGQIQLLRTVGSTGFGS
jgi:hypothetical protein